MKKLLSILVILSLVSSFANAQNYFGLLNKGSHIISVGVNANPDLNSNADYLFNFDGQSKIIDRCGFIVQANFPLFAQKGIDFDLRIGAGALVAFSNKFKSIAGLSWNFSRTEDLNGRYFHSGFKIDYLPGYYGSKWVFAPHFALNYQPWINIRHSEYATNTFQDLYPNNDGQFNAPKNGWFYQNNITLQSGIGIAYFQPTWHLNLTTGFQHQPNRVGIISLPDIGIMPFYGGLNFGYSISGK
jgi:hypothetical protein